MFMRTSRVLCASAGAPAGGYHFGLRSAFLIPHREKAYRGGEDSFFLHPSGLCAADGVGGWASAGVDPAIYTRKLVSTAHDALAAQPFMTTPQAILQRGVGANTEFAGNLKQQIVPNANDAGVVGGAASVVDTKAILYLTLAPPSSVSTALPSVEVDTIQSKL